MIRRLLQMFVWNFQASGDDAASYRNSLVYYYFEYGDPFGLASKTQGRGLDQDKRPTEYK